MTRRFTYNANFVAELKKSAVFNPVAIIALPLSVLFYIIGLSLNKEILNDIGDYIPSRLEVFSTIKIFFWVGLILSIALCIAYAIFISNKDYVRATNCGAAMCGYAGVECLIFMFNSKVAEYSDVANLKSLFIIFFILFFAVFIGEIMYPKYIAKKNSIPIENLEKCYFELKEKVLCGISFTNVNETGNGSYFEIPYTDIRDIRIAHPNAQTKQFYNLYIDTKYGTYNLLIEQNITACDIAKKAINDTIAGVSVSLFPNISNGTNTSVASDKATQAQYYATIGQWYCPNCGRPNQDYVGTCGCGTKKP